MDKISQKEHNWQNRTKSTKRDKTDKIGKNRTKLNKIGPTSSICKNWTKLDNMHKIGQNAKMHKMQNSEKSGH